MNYPYQIGSLEDYQSAYKKSVDDPAGFWAGIAEHFKWHKKWDKVLEWNFSEPRINWFSGGKLNITENCLDRHLAERGDQPAMVWEPNDPAEAHRVLTYGELHFKVCQFAHVLKNNGVKKGDRICLYMPMVPELAIAVLACARIGAIHSVVFGGFSAQSISDRILDAQCSVVITSDGAFRGSKQIPLKSVIDDALVRCPFVKKVIVRRVTPTVRQRSWMRKTCSSSSIRPVPPASPKGSYIPAAGTWSLPTTVLSMYSNTGPGMFISARPTSVGSPVIVILYMGH
jgi:acetyl-CoA synthetase